MLIKDMLNEFEADWAAMPAVENEKLSELKNKTIVISGHKIARCFCYALLYLNETKKLRTKVVLLGESRDILNDYNSELLLRNDFDFVDYYSVSEIKNADFIITTGLCGERFIDNVNTFKSEINAIKAVCTVAQNTKAKTILLSDCRIYGNAENHRVYSENEYAFVNNISTDDFDAQIFRTIECYANCFKKQSEFDLTILRTGIILGACTGIETVLDDLFEKVATGEKATIINSGRKYSFVYINDVFRAIVYALKTLKPNTVYNVSGINSTVSTGAISALLHDVYGEKANIELSDNGDFRGCAINANKIAVNGCEPQMKLETAVELCVMSRMKDNESMSLPHTHEGRLSAIQNIQLAYLLEVDRICRKHNIKYFLGGGTLLGAIRHKGFIPWDDDADIMMLREDYDKFCKIAESELPSSITFQTNENDRNCFYEFAKFKLNGTFFATTFAKEHKDMHNGIAFDIFCHDKTANSKLGRKLHLAMTLFTRALVFNKWNNRKTENGSKLQTAVTNFCIRLFPIRFSLWLERKTLKFFKNKKNAKYLYDGMGRNIYNGSFPIEYLDEVIYTEFEGYELPIPKEYDKYLTFLYGDYMELAPLSTRIGCHEIEVCDLGEYDGFKF